MRTEGETGSGAVGDASGSGGRDARARQPTWEHWLEPLKGLCDGLRIQAQAALRAAGAPGVSRPAAQGIGDVSFALDLACESFVDRWLRERARSGPLSLLTEDRGWRHFGPGPSAAGPAVELAGFDHAGPRLVLDPVDGTRNLMAGLRSAWAVLGFAPPGTGQPSFDELTGGLLSEIPTLRTRGHQTLWAARGQDGCTLEEVSDDGSAQRSLLRADEDDRADHGYFPVFRYEPRQRPAVAALEARFFERLERLEGAEMRSIYDDQYISNAGQLVLVSRGIYRMVIDPRALLADREGRATVCSKPYDVAGALVCAEAAGVAVATADGRPLDFPIDATTPVHFSAWANPATRERLEPHWLAALAQT